LVGPGANRPLRGSEGNCRRLMDRPAVRALTGSDQRASELRNCGCASQGTVAGARRRSLKAGLLSQDQSDGRFARHPAQCGESVTAADPARGLAAERGAWALSGFAGWPPENPPTGRLKGVSIRDRVWAPREGSPRNLMERGIRQSPLQLSGHNDPAASSYRSRAGS
jgi:hypothetical protein